jgi:hypothetical protein
MQPDFERVQFALRVVERASDVSAILMAKPVNHRFRGSQLMQR